MTLKLPIYAIIGLRPVKGVATVEGGMDILAYDWECGDFKREMDYLMCLVTGADEELEISPMEVDFVSEEEFEARTELLRRELRGHRKLRFHRYGAVTHHRLSALYLAPG